MSATTIAPTHTDEEIENLLIQDIAKNETISNSRVWAASHGIDHERVVGNLNSLVSAFLLDTDRGEESTWGLTSEAQDYIKFNATPEVQVFNAIPAEGVAKAKLVELLGGDQRAKLVESVGFGTALKNKWIANQKGENGPVVTKLVPSVEDTVLDTLKKLEKGATVSEADLTALKRRKLVENKKVKYFIVKKGAKFTTQRKKEQSDLTTELLVNNAWESEAFKAYNFNAKGKKNITGYLHPLLKVRTEFRNIFLEMGFEEMKTNQFVESSFWNFDALFQPQAHPVRDAHDTFFMKDPAETLTIPQDYLEKVKEVHEKGGYESIGYRYDWKVAEAKKNILRTHTTAVSSRYLYQIGKQIPTEGFKPRKFFSIDRVFRNEVPDQTHLCEFHQIEGMVIDKGLTLGDMISLFSTFFAKIGITDIKFKPAFNPYTEPSMEIFGFHPQLQRWVEVGNSGVFRPEMLRPMGIPEDVTVIAWGLSLERPTMILYEVDDIRDLVGHKVNIAKIRSNPICRLDKERVTKPSN